MVPTMGSMVDRTEAVVSDFSTLGVFQCINQNSYYARSFIFCESKFRISRLIRITILQVEVAYQL